MADEREILIRALEAAGHDQAAKMASVILPESAAAQAPAPVVAAASDGLAPAAPVAAALAAQQAALPTAPPGKAPLQNLDEYEALPQAERLARMNEVDALILAGAQ